MLWALATVAAAGLQVARNAAQAGLAGPLGTLGATQVRFLFGLPFAAVFLAVLSAAEGRAPPLPGAATLGFAAAGGLAQIGATAALLAAMRLRGLAVATALSKAEPALLALMAAAVLGDPLTAPMLAAIGMAVAGVALLSAAPAGGWSARPVALGLLAAALFGLAAVGYRGAVTSMPGGGAALRAATVLTGVLAFQAAVMWVWLAAAAPGTNARVLALWRPSARAGFFGAAASQFWFLAFALAPAAQVRTLALVEVAMALAVGRLRFGERLSARQAAGLALLAAGIAALLAVAG